MPKGFQDAKRFAELIRRKQKFHRRVNDLRRAQAKGTRALQRPFTPPRRVLPYEAAEDLENRASVNLTKVVRVFWMT